MASKIGNAWSITPGSDSKRAMKQRNTVIQSYLLFLLEFTSKTLCTIAMICRKKLVPESVRVRSVVGSLQMKFWKQSTTC